MEETEFLHGRDEVDAKREESEAKMSDVIGHEDVDEAYEKDAPHRKSSSFELPSADTARAQSGHTNAAETTFCATQALRRNPPHRFSYDWVHRPAACMLCRNKAL